MARHPLSALILLLAAWTQVLAPTLGATITPATGGVPICHAETPASGKGDAPEAPADRTCVFCLAFHAVADVPTPAIALGAPLRIPAAAPVFLPFAPKVRGAPVARARARSPPTLV